MNGKPAFYANCADCNCKSSIFKSLHPEELEQINMGRFHVAFKAGEIMFKQGTPSSHFVCVTSGLAKIYIEGYGKNLILSLVKPVDYIFGPGVYIDINTTTLFQRSMIPQPAWSIHHFKKLIRSNPDFAENFIKRISLQPLFNFEQVISLTQKQMPVRIADALFYLSEKIYGANPFNMTLSRQDLADLRGMSKESAIRILKEFKEEGILSSVDGNMFDILNIRHLKQISETG